MSIPSVGNEPEAMAAPTSFTGWQTSASARSALPDSAISWARVMSPALETTR